MTKTTLRYLLSGLAVMTVITGCSIRNGGFSEPGRPWSEAFVCHTSHYIVRTNTDPETAGHIGEFMERALTEYRAVMAYGDDPLPLFTINAYATRGEYEKVVRRQGLSAEITAGLYTPAPPATIHLPYLRILKVHPSATLLHEGVHQFIDQAISFRVPSGVQNILPPAKHRLMSAPVWLNEGFATYMEGMVTTEGRIEMGRINRNRLVHLQKLIRAGKCPPLKEVLERRYGETFTAKDYAVAWGIVYSLRHAPHANDQADRRTRLARYLGACRGAFYTDPDTEFPRDFLPGGEVVEDFNRRFATRIARLSLWTFEKIIVEKDSTLDIWEEDWAARILQLDPGNPYGQTP